VLDIDAEKIASVPLAQWGLVASTVAGVIGTVGAALRPRMTEATAPRPSRTRETEPPEAP